ncbi:MAG TPA: hypothetical protein DCO79_04970 [Spirochaeta sp.]|nr:hypothetical protein [Spirochaeta sp.]
MEIIKLKNIERKDSLIHYINKYDCIIAYKSDDKIHENKIGIILEKTALGTTNIQLEVKNAALQSSIESIKEYIGKQNKKGVFV